MGDARQSSAARYSAERELRTMVMPHIQLSADDDARIHARHAVPARPNGLGLVVIQEIFGVTAHIRAIADGYAAEGYQVLARSPSR